MSLDIVSKALHCYSCDDWIVREPPWLDGLRAEVYTHGGASGIAKSHLLDPSAKAQLHPP
jgi:hypothetical protein